MKVSQRKSEVLKRSPTFESPRRRYVIIITILHRLQIPQGKKQLNKSHHVQSNEKNFLVVNLSQWTLYRSQTFLTLAVRSGTYPHEEILV